MKQTFRWLLPALVGVAIFSNAALCGPHTPGHFFTAGNGSLVEYDAGGTAVRSFPGVADLYDVTISPRTSNLFASDPTGNKLYSIDYQTGAISTISNFMFNSPTDIVFGPGNKLFATNRGSNTVLEIWAEMPGVPAIVASSTIGQGYLDNPNGLAFDQSGRMFISSGTNSIVVLDANQNYQTTFNPTGLLNPGGLEFGANGNLYAVSGGSNAVMEINPLTGQVMRTFSGSEGLALADPLSLAVSETYNTLLVTDSQGVVEFDLATGDAIARYATGNVSGVAAVAPEPATLALLGIGLGAMAYRKRKNS